MSTPLQRIVAHFDLDSFFVSVEILNNPSLKGLNVTIPYKKLVIPFLQQLKEQGYLIALGSASKNAQIILEKTGLITWFHAIIDGNKVSKSKPDPEVFQKGAEALGCSSEECIVFEDSFNGMIAAKAARMKCVIVPHVTQQKDERFGAADLKISSLQNFGELHLNLVS